MSSSSEQPRRGIFTTLISVFEGARGTLLSLFLIPILYFLVFWLPPLSLIERILDADYTTLAKDGGQITIRDGTQLVIPGEAMPDEGTVKVRLTQASRQAFIEGANEGFLAGAPTALPPQLLIKSPIYLASIKGTMPNRSIWRLPLPASSEPYALLDLYAWDGSQWSWLPHQIWETEKEIESQVVGVPPSMAVMQAQALPVSIGVFSNENADFLSQADPTLSFLSPRLYFLQGDGSIGQLFVPSPVFEQSGAAVMPVLHNIDPAGIIRSDLVDNTLIAQNTLDFHLDWINRAVTREAYEGIIIDYRQVDAILRSELSQFMLSLSDNLRDRGKKLVVRVDEPIRVSENDFDTGAYHWPLIGQVADQVIVPLPRVAGSFAGADDLDMLLTYATSRIDRYKILIEFPSAPYTVEDGQTVPIAYREVVSLLLNTPVNEEGEFPELSIDALESLTQVTFDPSTGSYRLMVEEQEIAIENAVTVAQRLTRISSYHIGGVVITHPNEADPAIWERLSDYLTGQPIN